MSTEPGKGKGSERVPLGKEPTRSSAPAVSSSFSYRPKMVCFLSRYAQERKVMKLGEEDRGSGRARQPSPPSLLGPQDFWAHTRHPRPLKAAPGSCSSHVCAAPTPCLVRAGCQPRPPRGTGTPAPQEKAPGTAAQERPRKALPPASAAANFWWADRRCQSPQAETVGGGGWRGRLDTRARPGATAAEAAGTLNWKKADGQEREQRHQGTWVNTHKC